MVDQSDSSEEDEESTKIQIQWTGVDDLKHKMVVYLKHLENIEDLRL